MRVIFWCEFPEKTDWTAVNKLIDFKTEIYIASKTRKEYENWKKKIRNKNIKTGAWPTLTEEEGYWFSGFTKKEEVDKLKEFDKLDIKLDIEPPFPGRRLNLITMLFTYFIPHILKKGKNNRYLEEVIRKHRGKVIISGFPLPGWITRRFGDLTELSDNMEKNFISYTTLTPRTITRLYLKWFAKKAARKYGKKAIFGIGCIGRGIFRNEKTYENIEQFKQDVKLIREAGAKNIVIFTIEGIMERENRKEWVREIKTIYESSY
ncbi:MAG: hypothetical protein ABIH63_01260 [archaeon]